jgi:steroid delta-isomerase-like uncharacterized protein
MKRVLMILHLFLLLCFVIGCQDKAAMVELEEFRAQVALEKENKALAERYIDAVSKADFGVLKDILSPDYVHHPKLGLDESFEQALEGLKQRVTMFPDQSMRVQDLFVKEDKIAWRGIFSGTHTGDIEGFPATGKKVEMRGFAIMRVKSGKIAEVWGCRDLLSLYQQLGFELKPKGEK